jgi:hypothetical protein
VNLLVRKADFFDAYRFQAGSGAYVRPAYLAPLLCRSIVYIYGYENGLFQTVRVDREV